MLHLMLVVTDFSQFSGMTIDLIIISLNVASIELWSSLNSCCINEIRYIINNTLFNKANRECFAVHM